MFCTYILETNDKKYYIGSTQNIEERLIRHKNGECRFTKNRLPVRLVYKKNFKTRPEAVRFEKKLKAYKNRNVISKIIKHGPIV